MKKLYVGVSAFIFTFLIVNSSFGIAGIGTHWGNDFSLKMKDEPREQLSFEKLSIDTSGLSLGTLPSGLTEIKGKDLPIFLSRTEWQRSYVNGGLKIFVDIIPFLDAVELSTNFGLWQYEGKIRYPKSMTLKSGVNYANVKDPEDLFVVQYDSVVLTLERYGMGFGGLRKTPYMKLQFDLTIRKNIVKFPPVLDIIRIYGGGGFTLNFATPVLHKSIIEEALGQSLEDAFTLSEMGTNLFMNDKMMKKILEKIMGSLMTPHPGCHLDVGAMIKLPIIPIGVYADGKFLIPFDKMDPNVNLGGLGFLLNTGVSFSF